VKDEGFLARWSRRKIRARSAPETPLPAEPAPPAPAGGVPAAATAVPARPAPLPPLESLTPQSDFAPFMRAEVDPALKGQALKTLFSDPALYPMDGLDVYIDDYTKADPLPEGWLGKLNQFAALDGPAGGEVAEEAAADSPGPARAASGAAVPEAAPAVSSDTPDAQDSSSESMNRSAT
jgi:hypothetical protein